MCFSSFKIESAKRRLEFKVIYVLIEHDEEIILIRQDIALADVIDVKNSHSSLLFRVTIIEIRSKFKVSKMRQNRFPLPSL